MCRESGTPYQGQPTSSQGQGAVDQGEKIPDQSVSGQEQVVKSVGQTGQRSKGASVGHSTCKQDQQEGVSKQYSSVSTGQSDIEEVKSMKKPFIEGKERGGTEKDSTPAKDSTSCSDKDEPKPKSIAPGGTTPAKTSAGGSTPAKALVGQKPPGEELHIHISVRQVFSDIWKG